MDHFVGLATLGALLALDHAVFGMFMISQPLIVGGLFGGIMGDWTTGFLVGALVQLLWLSVIAVGAYIPPDHTITGGVTTALTLMLVKTCGHAFGPSIMLALVAAIPAGVVAGQLDALIRQGVNNRLAGWVEEQADHGLYPPLGVYHALSLIPAWLKSWVVYLVWLGPVAWLVQTVMLALPNRVIAGLELAYWALPALGFAVVVEMFTRERFPWWVVIFFALTWLAFWLWPQGLWIWLAVALSTSAMIAWKKHA